jgi:hypothetical protein
MAYFAGPDLTARSPQSARCLAQIRLMLPFTLMVKAAAKDLARSLPTDAWRRWQRRCFDLPALALEEINDWNL